MVNINYKVSIVHGYVLTNVTLTDVTLICHSNSKLSFQLSRELLTYPHDLGGIANGYENIFRMKLVDMPLFCGCEIEDEVVKYVPSDCFAFAVIRRSMFADYSKFSPNTLIEKTNSTTEAGICHLVGQ